MAQNRNRHGLDVVTPPAAEPVTLDEAKAQCSITGSDHDTRLNSLITRARSYVEDYTGRAMITQTFDYYLDNFSTPIALPNAPLQSVTSIKYFDTSGVQQTLDAGVYTVSTVREPGEITTAYEQSWPDIRYIPDAIVIRFVCGYGAASTDVPDTLRHAMLLLISHWFENTEAQGLSSRYALTNINFDVAALLDPYRIWRV